MKFIGLGILITLLVLTHTPIEAQPEQDSRWLFYLNTGFSLAVSEGLSDFAKTGLNAGGGAGYMLNKRMILQGYLDYNRFAMDEKKSWP